MSDLSKVSPLCKSPDLPEEVRRALHWWLINDYPPIKRNYLAAVEFGKRVYDDPTYPDDWHMFPSIRAVANWFWPERVFANGPYNEV
jgi:hypothetical protein